MNYIVFRAKAGWQRGWRAFWSGFYDGVTWGPIGRFFKRGD